MGTVVLTLNKRRNIVTKSDIAKEIAEQQNPKLIDVPLSKGFDRADFLGQPVIDTSNMIFVFGSNTGGIHGAGAARFALEHRGARMGVGFGLIGQSYAIPTKGVYRHKRRGQAIVKVGDTLDLSTIKRYVDEFLRDATKRQDLMFQVTCIGCGLAGLTDEDVAPMFLAAPENCVFDEFWRGHLGDTGPGPQGTSFVRRYWGSF